MEGEIECFRRAHICGDEESDHGAVENGNGFKGHIKWEIRRKLALLPPTSWLVVKGN